MKVPFLDLKSINESFEPELSEEVLQLIHSGWYILGPELEKFENNFTKYCGTKHCIGVGNGLDALIIIWECLKIRGDLKPGDEVLVPANTYIASIQSILKAGLTPVLCEPDPVTLNLTVNQLDKYVTHKTKAVLMVHLYGLLTEGTAISEFCDANKLILIEDAAQAHGAIGEENKRAGNIGLAAGFSFYPGKNLGALGDGGAITTNDTELASLVAMYRNYGSREKYFNEIPGVNSRLDPLQAVVLNLKLKRLDEDNEKRRKIAERYLSEINNDHIRLPYQPALRESHVWHIFTVQVNKREHFQRYLADNGIATLIHYPLAPHQQKAMAEFNNLNLPVTETIHESVISLPLSPVMTAEEAAYVIKVCNAYNG